MEERIIQVRKEDIGDGEEKYLGGMASYKRVVDKFIGNNMVLCNNIVNVDNELLYNRECGFEDYDDLYKKKLEELKEDYKEKLKKEEMTIGELEDMATEYAEYETDSYEFYQYYIIYISNFNLEYLQKCKQKTLKICYSELLDCYVLCADHFGTSWDYIGSDFKLKIVK